MKKVKVTLSVLAVLIGLYCVGGEDVWVWATCYYINDPVELMSVPYKIPWYRAAVVNYRGIKIDLWR